MRKTTAPHSLDNTALLRPESRQVCEEDKQAVMADETTLKADVKDKRRAEAEENSARVREERSQSGKMHLRRSSSAVSESQSSSKQTNTGVDCADVVLKCLFCRFSDLIFMIPDSCGRLTDHCCPDYKYVITTVELDTTPDDGDDCAAFNCGFLGSCHDASDCLELAMEVSEVCYH
ncbi:myoD family inhibitor domain-containing protein 2 [Menidia menidia]